MMQSCCGTLPRPIQSNEIDSSFGTSPQVNIFEQSDFQPLRSVQGGTIPVGPFLRPRGEISTDMIHLSWLQYLPTCLLYDHSFFGGTDTFKYVCNMPADGKIPSLPWKKLLPPKWHGSWMIFLSHIRKGSRTCELDKAVIEILPIFSTGLKRLLFRTMTSEEVVQASGLHDHFATVGSDMTQVSETTIRNICGNCFHPDLI